MTDILFDEHAILVKKISRSLLVPYSAQQMYELVNDIESYSEFIPGCVRATILKRGDSFVEAELVIRKVGFEHSFTTRNTMIPHKTILLELIEGPFKTFFGEWSFQDFNQSQSASKVNFDLSYEFNNRLLALAGNKIFELLASEQIDNLSVRAKLVYGA